MNDTVSGDRYVVPALQRGMQLLGQFSRNERELTGAELSRRLDLPRASVFRLLQTLEQMGFVERVGDTASYKLGIAVLRLGFEYLASLELTQLGTPLLQRLCDQTGYPSNLVVRDGRSIVYVAKVAPPRPFSSTVSVGTRLPAHATVFGHVLLSDLDQAALRALYPEDRLQTYTASTPASVAELQRMTQAVRERGHVVGRGFFEAHIATVGAPVRDAAGHVVAALGITVPSDLLDEPAADLLLERVCAAAAELSSLLDHQAPSADARVVPLRRSAA